MTGSKFYNPPPQIFAFYIPDAAPANPRTKRTREYISFGRIVRRGASSSLSRARAAFVTTLHILIQADAHKYSLMASYLWESLCFSDSPYLCSLSSYSCHPRILRDGRHVSRRPVSVNEKVAVLTWVFAKWWRESPQPEPVRKGHGVWAVR